MGIDFVDRIDHARRYFYTAFPTYRQFSDDFAQWCALKWLEGKYKNTTDTFFRMGLDYLRRHHKKKDTLIQPTSYESNISSDLLAVVSSFEERERAVCILFYKWGMSHAEIGEIFGLSTNTISQIIFRIRKVLKVIMNESRLS